VNHVNCHLKFENWCSYSKVMEGGSEDPIYLLNDLIESAKIVKCN
jgi:hypothetical protein